jgi:hypothetical protein
MLTELQKVLRQELRCLCSKPTTVLLEWTIPKTTNVSLLCFNCIRYNTFYRYTVQKCIYAVYILHTCMYRTVCISTSGIVSHCLGWRQSPSARTVLNRNFVFRLHNFDSRNVFQEFYSCVKQGLPVYRKRTIFHGCSRSLKCTSGSVLWTINMWRTCRLRVCRFPSLDIDALTHRFIQKRKIELAVATDKICVVKTRYRSWWKA